MHLTELEWVTILTLGVPIIGSWITNIFSHYKIIRIETKVAAVKSEVADVAMSVNGRLTQLLELTIKASKAEGAKEEKDHQIRDKAEQIIKEKLT